jgi:D-alanyl-D-alanine carboxypeptidase (penicillin-binding protein 5/6)
MNSRAAELGLRRTHFANPSGLPDPSHVSTARDLATLAREALQHPEFRRRVALQEAEMRYERPGQKGWQKRELVTTNRLMRPGHPDYWEAADGIKTGYTKEAGRCLAASATVDGWQLLAVVLGCEDCWRDARQLLQRGFAEYRREAVVVAHTTSATVRVMDGTRPEVKAVAKSSVATIVPRGAALVRPRVIEEYPTAPIRPGEAVGELVVVRSDGTEARATLVAAEAVPRSLGARLRDHAGVLVASVVGLTLLGVLLVHGAVAKAAGPSRSRVASRVRRDGEGRPGHGERPGDPPSGTPGERRTRSGTA